MAEVRSDTEIFLRDQVSEIVRPARVIVADDQVGIDFYDQMERMVGSVQAHFEGGTLVVVVYRAGEAHPLLKVRV